MIVGRRRRGDARRPVRSSVLIVACQSSQSLAVGGIALFLPLIRHDLNLSFTQGGILAAVNTAVYALMQVPSGLLADRFGPKRLFVIGLFGVNALTILFSLEHTYPQLVVNQAVSGIFRSLVFAPGLLLIIKQFPADRTATALGVYIAGGFSSNVVLSSIGPALVGVLGWRELFVIFAASSLVALLALALTVDDVPPAGAAAVSARAVRQLLSHPVLWLCGLIQFVRLAVVTGLTFWLPSLIVNDKGHSIATAGAITAIGAIVTAPANFVGGYISDRYQRPLSVIGISLSALCVTIASIAVVRNLALLILVVVLMSVFLQLYFGPLFEVPLRYLGRDNAGLTSGIGNLFANLGGMTSTLGLGAVKDATGSFDTGLAALAALCALGVVATAAIARIARPGE